MAGLLGWGLTMDQSSPRQGATPRPPRVEIDHPLQPRSLADSVTAPFLKVGKLAFSVSFSDLRRQVRGFQSSFWEEVASAYNQNLLDNEWFKTDFAWQIRQSWERAAWFISRYRRKEDNVNFWSEWQVAVDEVKGDLDRQEEDGKARAAKWKDSEPDLLAVDQPGVVFRI
jgi:hypothetical protein